MRPPHYIWILLLVPSFAAAFDSVDRRYVDGLRERRLFSLAETFCRERLAVEGLSDAARSGLVIEFSRCLAAHAMHSPSESREALWSDAIGVPAEFERDHARAPRLLLVRVQGALVRLARGELARQEAEVGPRGPEQASAARGQLREAVGQLEAIDEAVARQLRMRQRPMDALSEGELLSLQKHVHYQMARGYRNQALTYADGSADRTAALLQAIRRLEPLAEFSTDQPVVWPSRIDQVVCHRLLKQFHAAGAKLRALHGAEPPPAIQSRALAEQVQLDLDRGDLQGALAAFSGPGDPEAGSSSPELDLAYVATCVACWQKSSRDGDDDQSGMWQARAAGRVGRMERSHGAYWTRRAQMLLASAAAAGSGAGNVDVLVQSAHSFYTRRQYHDAVASYDLAADKARALGDADRWFQLRLTAAHIQHDLDHTADALRRFRTLALDGSSHPGASDAHLWAVFNAAKLARPGESVPAEQYIALLVEHLERWPEAASADVAGWWLGQLRQHQADWAAAIDAYQQITPPFRQFADAVEACGQCWPRRLDQLAKSGEPIDAEVARAVAYFDRVILGAEPAISPDTKWSHTQRVAAVAVARLKLQYQRGAFDQAEQILKSALRDSSDAPVSWKTEARLLRVVALAGRRRHEDAQGELPHLVDASIDELLALLNSLRGLESDAEPAASSPLAQLQLDIIGLLDMRRDQLDTRARRVLERHRAAALAAAGRTREALVLYDQLAGKYPRDERIRVAYAQLLLAGDDEPTLQRALSQWREVAARSPPRTEPWYRAKYTLALVHFRLQDKQRAASIIRLIQAVPPGLEQTSLRGEFLDLLKRCQ